MCGVLFCARAMWKRAATKKSLYLTVYELFSALRFCFFRFNFTQF